MPAPAFDDFVQLCRTSAKVDSAQLDLRALEPHLLRVLEFLKAHPELRPQAARYLVDDGLDRPGAAAATLLEFCMRELRWPEVREALEKKIEQERDPSRRLALRNLLEVYEPEWPDADLFEYYSPRTR
jgi:hypothetical protein